MKVSGRKQFEDLRRRAAALALGAVICLSLPAIGLAAHPRKSSSYVGNLSGTSTRTDKRVVVRVGSSGRSGSVRLECSSTRAGTIRRFRISSSGRFTAIKKTGSLLVWRLRGRFSSSTRATAKLYLPAVCDGRGGRITLELQ